MEEETDVGKSQGERRLWINSIVYWRKKESHLSSEKYEEMFERLCQRGNSEICTFSTESILKSDHVVPMFITSVFTFHKGN